MSDQNVTPFMKIAVSTEAEGAERREHRRYDLGNGSLAINRWDSKRRRSEDLGYVVDVSAGGVRVCTSQSDIRPDSQIRVRLEMPSYAGISPFIDTQNTQLRPKNEWIGWLSVARVAKRGTAYEVSGRLVDMDEMDRGMLGLYLSTQPLAA